MVKIVISLLASTLDPTDYAVFQALFGMIFTVIIALGQHQLKQTADATFLRGDLGVSKGQLDSLGKQVFALGIKV